MNVRRYDALALTAGIWFLGKFLRYAFPPLFATLQDTYGVSNTVIGSAYGAMMIAYAAMQFPSGALSDRLGPVRVITVGALVAAVGALSVVIPGPLPLLVAGMVLVGLGSGAHKTVAVPMLSNIYTRNPGRALGVLDTLGAFGGVVAPPLVFVMLDVPGWRYVFVLGGLAGLVLAAGFRLRVPDRLPGDGAGTTVLDDDPTPDDGERGRDTEPEPGPDAEPDPVLDQDPDPVLDQDPEPDPDLEPNPGPNPTPTAESETPGAYRALLHNRPLTVVVVATVLSSFAFNGAVAFLPLFLTEEVGLSAAFASAVYSSFFLVSLVQLGTGEVGDRVGMLPVLAGALALGAVGLAGVVVVGAPFAVAATVVAFGLGMHGHRPVRGAYFAALLPRTGGGGAFGVIRTAIIGAGAAASPITGYLIDSAGYRPAFTVLVAAMVAAAVFTAGLLVGGRVRRVVPG